MGPPLKIRGSSNRTCMSAASRPEEAGQACFDEAGLDYTQVKKCAESSEGQEIHYRNGEIHNSLNPSAWGVPWPTWDGVGGDDVINETDELGLIGYLCKHYYNNDLPNGVCNKFQTSRKMTLKN